MQGMGRIGRDPLAAESIIGLHAVLEMVLAQAHVRRAVEGDYTVSGTVRSLTGPDGDRQPLDIRDCFVRITLDAGLDVFVPVLELAWDVSHGTLGIAYK